MATPRSEDVNPMLKSEQDMDDRITAQHEREDEGKHLYTWVRTDVYDDEDRRDDFGREFVAAIFALIVIGAIVGGAIALAIDIWAR